MDILHEDEHTVLRAYRELPACTSADIYRRKMFEREVGAKKAKDLFYVQNTLDVSRMVSGVVKEQRPNVPQLLIIFLHFRSCYQLIFDVCAQNVSFWQFFYN
jgi:hypothetical protein